MTYPSVPLRRVSRVKLGKMLQSSPSGGEDVEAPYLRAAHIQPDGRLIELGSEQKMWFGRNELREHDLLPGDVVIVEGGAGYGRSAVIRQRYSDWGFQNSVIRLRPIAGCAHGAYLDYGLQAAISEGRVALTANTATIPHFTAEKVSGFALPMAPYPQQRAIADFLDRETAKIDALIEKQTKLIDRLRERRVEAVASAVTKGIHGSALISVNSDWMDHLPESWSVGRIQYDFEVVLGKMLDAGKEAPVSSTLLPYIRAANIQPWGLLLDDINEMPYTPREASRLDLRLGDLLVVEGGSVGVSHLLREAMPGWSFQKTVNRVRSRSGASTHFLHYVLDFYRNRGVFGIVCSGSTIAHLTSEKLRAMDWPKPPLDEQRQIAVHLDRETAKIDALIAKAERFIELARERRSALITAAVTGQIDVTEGAA